MEHWHIVLVTLAVTHALALAAGGYLHYRFGKTVDAAAEALKNLPR